MSTFTFGACIPNDWHSRYTSCLATGKAAEATSLLRIVKAAQAAGNASGFEPEIAALTALSEGRVPTFGKAALPLDLAKRVAKLDHMATNATTEDERDPLRKEAAALNAEITQHDAFKAALTRPRCFFGPGSDGNH